MKYFNNRDSKGRFTKVQGNANVNTNTIKEENTMKTNNTNTTKKATTTAEYKVSTGKEMTSLEFTLNNLNNGVRIITPIVNGVRWNEFGMAYVTEADKENMITFFNEVINATGGDKGKSMRYLMEFAQNATSKEFMEKYKKGELKAEKKGENNTLTTQAVKDEDNTYEVNIGGQMSEVEFTIQALNGGVRVILPVVNGEAWPELRMGYIGEKDKEAMIKCFNAALAATGGNKYKTMRYLYEFYQNATSEDFMQKYQAGDIAKEVEAEKDKEYFDIDGCEYFIDYIHKYLVDNETGEIVADLDCYKNMLKEDLTHEQVQTLLIREFYLNQNNN